ncbi:retrovirus-related pol polyprotein from transposon TNT 1-94 [Tanacetum coccineum]|uniref:Retrovirus-related pol polyprotein from transposon TNT 1-94 n=1 Tax=Tanacetum coccineum TaxID=301880 RepID=A0ABQ4Y9C4_9ASTR
MAEGADKPESQWTPNERRVVNQVQRLKSIIISCLQDDIIESVISCETAKDTWTDLVHSFEGPSDTKENMIMDLKLKYQTFRAKTFESLSQTYTLSLRNSPASLKDLEMQTILRPLTLLISIEGLSMRTTLSQGDTQIQKALITTPTGSPISIAFFSNNIIQDFQENSNNEADERTSEEYLRDLDIEFHERAPLANLKHFIKRKNNFSIQKANEDTECYKCSKKGHLVRDCFSKTSEPSYKSPMSNSSSMSRGFQPKFTPKFIQSTQHAQSSQGKPKTSKPFQSKNKGLVAETFDWDEEEVSDDEEETRVQVLMALADDELSVGKNHAPNGKWIDITMKKLTRSSSKNDAKGNPFVPAFLDYDHEMVLKSKNWVERLNPDIKLPNFNTGRILVLDSEAVNESLQLTVRYGLGTMKHTKPKTQESSNKNVSRHVTVSNPELVTCSVHTKVKTNDQESKINELTKLVQMLMDEKINSTQKSQEPIFVSSQPESSKILYCMKCKREDHKTSDHDMYIASLRSSQNYKAQPYQGGVLAESFKSSKSSIGVSCATCGSSVHSTTDHNDFEHFKRETHQGAHLVLRQWMLKEYGWCQELSAQIYRATRPINPMSINHEKYTLIIVDEHSRYTWVYFLKMKSQAPEMIMSFVKMVENQNDVKVKQIRTDNGTKFRNTELESFCDEKGISQNFSSPYTLE